MSKVGGIDYDLVEKTGRRILAGKSKDLRVLAYLSLGYVRAEHWEALADVFEGLARLADSGLDGMFPERPRARQMALAWLSEPRFVDALAGHKPGQQHHEHFGRLLEALEKLRPTLARHFAENPPFPAALHKAAKEWRTASAPKPAGQAQSQSGAAAAPATPSQAIAEVRKAALLLIEKEPQKPLGYRLLRACRWDQIEKAPPVVDGRTQMEGPVEQQRTNLAALAAQREWKALLEKSELAFAGRGCHLWLDLQRHSARACEGLGEAFRTVREAVIAEMAALVRRVPELPGLRFADGTECCDSATREWLAKTAAARPGQGAAGPAEPAEQDTLAKEMRDAEALAGAGKLADALAVLKAGMRSGSSARDNFRRSMLMGSLLLAGKQPQVAVSVLESLSDTVDEYRLERWDPDLAAEALAGLLGAYRMARAAATPQQQAALAEKQQAVLARISRIDPGRALALHA